jgi:uncharacterized damage-inducible protein DinB
MKDLIDTWLIHCRINLYLLQAIDDELLQRSAAKGRSAGEQFAHLHNVRLMWLKVAASDLFAQQTKIEKETPLTRQLLQQSLEDSGAAIAMLLEKGIAEGKIKGFKPHPSAFVGYLISHESHHRGQLILLLKQAGHKLDAKVLYGLWEWGGR